MKLRGRFDTVLVDPARAGLHPGVVEALKRLSPEVIIHVSCNPYTQAEDIKKLEGYEAEKFSPFDMFPHTPHVENIALLSRC